MKKVLVDVEKLKEVALQLQEESCCCPPIYDYNKQESFVGPCPYSEDMPCAECWYRYFISE